MATLTWEDFRHGKIAVTFKTEQEYDTFMQACEAQSITWASGDKATDGPKIYINAYLEAGINFAVGCEHGRIVHGELDEWYADNYDVINYADIDKIKTEPAANRQKRTTTPPEAVDAAARVTGRVMEELIKIADAHGLDRNSFIAKSIDLTAKIVHSSDFSQWELQEVPDNE